MPYRMIFIWVEGDDDERLLDQRLGPELMCNYDYIKFIKWAYRKKDYIKRYITSIRAMNADYLFLRDFNAAPCITMRKTKTKDNYDFLDEHRICIVVQEIESWYLAGLNLEASAKLGIKNFGDTNSVTKEEFDAQIAKHFDSRVDFMQEILKYFSIDSAKIKNRSFKYFFEKHVATI